MKTKFWLKGLAAALIGGMVSSAAQTVAGAASNRLSSKEP